MNIKKITRWYLALIFSVQKILIKKCELKKHTQNFRVNSNISLKEFDLTRLDELIYFHDNFCTEWNFLFTKDEVKQRISQGHKCYIAITDANAIIGCYWIGGKPLYSPDLRAKVMVPKDSLIEFNGFIAKNYRGLNILPRLRNMAFNDFFDKGYKWVYGYSLSTNIAIANSSKKHNFKCVGKVYLGFILTHYYMIKLFDKECLIQIEKL